MRGLLFYCFRVSSRGAKIPVSERTQ